MHQLMAKEGLRYAGRDFSAGDCFDALSDSDAVVLKKTGKAIDAPPTISSPEPTSEPVSALSEVQSRNLIAAGEEQKPPTRKGSSQRRGNGRGRYSRTDMRPIE